MKRRDTAFPTRVLRLALALALAAGPAGAAPYISEFLASNITGLKDEDGDESDWIEIHNPDATAVDLTGWGLGDLASLEEPWRFPAVTLAPGARITANDAWGMWRHLATSPPGWAHESGLRCE